jgi:hypothetical protein
VNLQTAFGFAVRLFIAFVVSKLILDRLGEGSPASLLGLALLLVSGVYGLGYWGGRLSWAVARFLISLNQLPSRREAKSPPKEGS